MKRLKNITVSLSLVLISSALFSAPLVATAENLDMRMKVLVGVGMSKLTKMSNTLKAKTTGRYISGTQDLEDSQVVGFGIGVFLGLHTTNNLEVGIEAFFDAFGSFERNMVFKQASTADEALTEAKSFMLKKAELSGFGGAVVLGMKTPQKIFIFSPYAKAGVQYVTVKFPQQILEWDEDLLLQKISSSFSHRDLIEAESRSKWGIVIGGGVNLISKASGALIGVEAVMIKVSLPELTTEENKKNWEGGKDVTENLIRVSLRFGYSF